MKKTVIVFIPFGRIYPEQCYRQKRYFFKEDDDFELP